MEVKEGMRRMGGEQEKREKKGAKGESNTAKERGRR